MSVFIVPTDLLDFYRRSDCCYFILYLDHRQLHYAALACHSLNLVSVGISSPILELIISIQSYHLAFCFAVRSMDLVPSYEIV